MLAQATAPNTGGRIVNAVAIHSELMRVLARRGELTADLEQTDLAIARLRGMFDFARALEQQPAPDPAAPSTPANDSAPLDLEV